MLFFFFVSKSFRFQKISPPNFFVVAFIFYCSFVGPFFCPLYFKIEKFDFDRVWRFLRERFFQEKMTRNLKFSYLGEKLLNAVLAEMDKALSEKKGGFAHGSTKVCLFLSFRDQSLFEKSFFVDSKYTEMAENGQIFAISNASKQLLPEFFKDNFWRKCPKRKQTSNENRLDWRWSTWTAGSAKFFNSQSWKIIYFFSTKFFFGTWIFLEAQVCNNSPREDNFTKACITWSKTDY